MRKCCDAFIRALPNPDPDPNHSPNPKPNPYSNLSLRTRTNLIIGKSPSVGTTPHPNSGIALIGAY
jgi:hypothetical protein